MGSSLSRWVVVGELLQRATSSSFSDLLVLAIAAPLPSGAYLLHSLLDFPLGLPWLSSLDFSLSFGFWAPANPILPCSLLPRC